MPLSTNPTKSWAGRVLNCTLSNRQSVNSDHRTAAAILPWATLHNIKYSGTLLRQVNIMTRQELEELASVVLLRKENHWKGFRLLMH